MNRDFVILTDSSADLSASVLEKYGIAVVELSLCVGGETKRGSQVEPKEFYEFLRGKTTVTTSAVNMQSFIEFFEPYLQAGKDILYLGFSSGLSTTSQSAAIAAQELQEKYPQIQSVMIGRGLIADPGMLSGSADKAALEAVDADKTEDSAEEK